VSAGIPVDPEAVLLVDVGHIYWRSWHINQSSKEAYRETVEQCQNMAKWWPNMVVCADSPRNFRHALTEHLEPAARYKANRKSKPEDAVQGLVDAEERLADTVRLVKVDGYEADDLIATLKTQAWLHRVIIKTEDKDLAQLVDDNCVMWTRYGERGPAEVQGTYGVPPSLIRDLLAMWGDDSDNVFGCPRIGQGFACKLLNAFGSIDAVKTEAEKPDFKFKGIGPERVASIRAWDPELAVKLVSLATDAPVNLEALLGGAGKQETEWPNGTIF
jgi:5'-3' exonuclease